MCWFPFLERHKDQILEQIRRDFDQVLPHIPQVVLCLTSKDNFVVDFVLAPPVEIDLASQASKYENLKVFIIELNPLAEFAGSGMFDWFNARDKG